MRIGAMLAGVLALAGIAWALAGANGSGTTQAGEVTATSGAGTSTVVSTGTAAATGTVGGVTTTPAPTRTVVVATQTPAGEGCTPGFWKTHTNTTKYPHAWPDTPYTTGQTLGSVFAIPAEFSSLSGDSLLTALSYGGGPDDIDAAKLLLHHAVAAILNASHPDIDYPGSAAGIIADVNAALASSDRDTMLDLKGDLAADNEAGCPINGK